MKPPFRMHSSFYPVLEKIAHLLGRMEGQGLSVLSPQLRRKNTILSIQSSLAIEGNSLSVELVTDVVNNKKVRGPKRDVLEVQNAIQLYNKIKSFKALDEKHFLKAHKILMHKLLSQAGQFRNTQVGVFQQGRLVHQAPSARLVPELIHKLFKWLKTDTSTHPIVKSCIGHYEIEFIHPFADGNGRMGRFWQSTLLAQHHPVFYHLPVEELIKRHQQSYYKALAKSDRQGHATAFIQYMLPLLEASLQKVLQNKGPQKYTRAHRFEILKEHLSKQNFNRKQYLQVVKTISPATASRDLKHWVEEKKLLASGTHNTTLYRCAQQ